MRRRAEHVGLVAMASADPPAPEPLVAPLTADPIREAHARILLAEGDAAVADLTGSVLLRHGFSVVAVHDGIEALRRWAEYAPDLVLLEVNLARRSGFEVCEAIRRQSQTPVIMLTTRADEADVLRAFTAGADDYITKPFSPLQLVMRITAVLRRG